ncbi:hypothetical protein [Cellulomonas sp. HD19AZ1]|uniref:hypothetical protein n=1 Tax=Cellulomonas TaxID=1707 RepID=UPI0010712AB3|nr:hypothetical protein [Cellulomonas sp. HD19AZ1]TFH69891.1 hypothetical protein E4A51_13670 [Cellulomonas sp. HD19AZ1]
MPENRVTSRGAPRSPSRATVAGRALAVALTALALVLPTAATASPLSVGGVDGYAPLSGAPCATVTRPGTSGLADILRRSYPVIPASTSIRSCTTDQYISDHSRGLAIDWSAPAGSAAGQQVLDWLFESDGGGNAHVRLRRLGISYIIWDNKIWSASNATDRGRVSSNVSTWRNYDSASCFAKYSTADCRHVRHMHISLSDAGGQRATSWWQPAMDGHRDSPTGVAETTPVPALPSRLLAVRTGDVDLKEGPLNAGWSRLIDGVEVVEAITTPTRVGVLTGDGRLLLKDGPVGAPWMEVATGVVDIALGEDRIGVVWSTGQASIKEGPFDAAWTTVAAGGASAIELTDNRIGVLVNGDALVKEGPVGAMFTTVSSNVDELVLDGDRLAVRKNGAVHVKEGSLGAGWTTVLGAGAIDAELGGGRVAVRTADKVIVKEGPLGAQWTTVLTGPTTSLSVTNDRIGVVTANGNLVVKEGSLGAQWTTVTSGSAAVDLS